MANGDTAVTDPKPVRVLGPDKKMYAFPAGTTKDKAVSYFKTKGIGAATQPEAAPVTAPQPQQQPLDARIGQWAEERFGTKAEMKAPSWYGATAKYLAGEGVGAGLAASGVASGTAKMGYHLLSALSADINPFMSHEDTYKAQLPVTEDAKNFGKGIAQMATSLLHADTYTDPVKFGGEVANLAMTVDGAKKMAEHFADKSPLPPAEKVKAVDVAGDHTLQEAVLKPRVHAMAWAQLKGAELGKKFMAARRQVSQETNAQFDNISKQIDTKVPQGSIAVGDLVKTIKDNYAAVVKTPEKMNSALAQLVDHAQKIQPGLSQFETVKQFRTKVFKAMKEGDPQGSVLGKTYDTLSGKLQATASRYGLGDAWSKANKLREVTSHYDDAVLNKIKKAGVDGHEVLNALRENKTLTAKLATDLKPYGLDPTSVMKDVKLAEKVTKAGSAQNYRLFRYAYGAGIPVTIGMKVFGHAGYLPSLAAGAATGIAASYATALTRALQLHPEVLRMLNEEEHLPGKSDLPKGKFPDVPPPEPPETKSLPGIPTEPKVPPGFEGPKEPLQLPGVPVVDTSNQPERGGAVLKEVERAKPKSSGLPPNASYFTKHPIPDSDYVWRTMGAKEYEKLRVGDITYKGGLAGRAGFFAPTPESASQYGSKGKFLVEFNKPGIKSEGEGLVGGPIDNSHIARVWKHDGSRFVEQVDEGEHGTGRLAKQSKGRERAAKGETTPGYERSARAGERRSQRAAATKAPSQASIDMGQVSAPEMEQFLENANPVALSGLKKLLKGGKIDDPTYTQSLRHFTIEAYENLGK